MIRKPAKRFGGALGDEFAKLWEAVVANQINSVHGGEVDHTSTGTIIRVGKGRTEDSSSTTTTTTTALYAGGIYQNLDGITTTHGQQHFYGDAHLAPAVSGASSLVNWVGPALLSEVAFAQSVYTYVSQTNGFIRPVGTSALATSRWALSSSYAYQEMIMLGKLTRSIGIGQADGTTFVADYVDLNTAGRVWEWIT